jgi:HAE1 family hydrophobic/amphiphilic exporter-1
MSKFFINHPIVAIVIAIFFVIAGAVMVLRLPIAQFPDIVPPQIQTTATYPGADALTVEGSVATPIEEQVNGAKNMIYMQSINGNDGTMTLQVSFEVGTDVDLDQVQVQNRLSQATSSLPAQVSNYGLTTQQTVGIPLLVLRSVRPRERGIRPSSPTTSRSISKTNSAGFPASVRSKYLARPTMRCGFGSHQISFPSFS